MSEGSKVKAESEVSWVMDNGLQVVCLPLPYVEYIALNVLMPGGVTTDAPGEEGSSLLLSELLSRGTKSYSSKELLTAFDNHGIRHGEGGSLLNSTLRASFLPDKLNEALGLLSSMLCEPTFPADAIDSVRALFLHDLRSVKENPSRLAMLELARRYYPEPYNRSPLGQEAGFAAASQQSLASQWKKRYGPKGAILSIAGRCTPEEVKLALEASLGKWNGACEELPVLTTLPDRKNTYLHFPGTQQQLLLRYPTAPMESPHYYTAKVLSQILSGGMFGRLFIEVREKRGLCYSVFAQHAGRLEYGTLTAYAGTTPERVHETYEVMVEILKDPIAGLTAEELKRAKNNLLSQIVLSEESTSARSRSNAADWSLIGRVRDIQEIHEAVSKVDQAAIQELLETYPLEKPAALTLGAKNFGDWEQEQSSF